VMTVACLHELVACGWTHLVRMPPSMPCIPQAPPHACSITHAAYIIRRLLQLRALTLTHIRAIKSCSSNIVAAKLACHDQAA